VEKMAVFNGLREQRTHAQTAQRPSGYREFTLQERESGPPPADTAIVRKLLRQSYPLPSDTFITESLPELITRLSLFR